MIRTRQHSQGADSRVREDSYPACTQRSRFHRLHDIAPTCSTLITLHRQSGCFPADSTPIVDPHLYMSSTSAPSKFESSVWPDGAFPLFYLAVNPLTEGHLLTCTSCQWQPFCIFRVKPDKQLCARQRSRDDSNGCNCGCALCCL